MSDDVSRFRYNIHELPSSYINYFVNDAVGAHRREIESLPDGGTVILDITRDIFSGVVEIEDGVYILDPVQGIDILDGLTKDNINYEIVKSVIKSDIRIINYKNDAQEFDRLWSDSFERMMDLLSKKFRNVFVLEIYFTSNLAGNSSENPLDSEYADSVNEVLRSMYNRVRSINGCRMVTIDTEKMLSGVKVDWGGPTYTHFIDETYATFCDRIMALASNGSAQGYFIDRAAFGRARAHEESLAEIDILNERIDSLCKNKNQSDSDYERRIVDLCNKNEDMANVIEQLSRGVIENNYSKHVFVESHFPKEIEDSNYKGFEKNANIVASRLRELSEFSERNKTLQQSVASFEGQILNLTTQNVNLQRELGIARRSLTSKIKRRIARLTFPLRQAQIGRRQGR